MRLRASTCQVVAGPAFHFRVAQNSVQKAIAETMFCAVSRLRVHLSSVSQFDDEDDELQVADLVDNPVLAEPHSIQVVCADELPHAGRAGIQRKLFYTFYDPLLDLPGEFPDLTARQRGKLYPVDHMAIL